MLYTTDQKIVTAYGDYVPYMNVPSIKSIMNSTDVLNIDEVRKVEHLPVERWYMDGVESFVAFDPFLRDMLQYRIEHRAIELSARSRRMAEAKQKEIELLQSRTIWDMIKLKFKRKEK